MSAFGVAEREPDPPWWLLAALLVGALVVFGVAMLSGVVR